MKWLITAAVVFLMVCLFVFMVADAKQWQRYAAQHNCHKTGRTDETWYTTTTMVGNTIITTPQVIISTEYQCDNGFVWR